MTSEDQIKQLKEALKIAAEALSIAVDWNVDVMQIEVPKDWNLDTEDLEEGWYNTRDLAEKCEQLSK